MSENERVTIGKAIQDYLNFHELNRDSEGTIKNYRFFLGRFAEWLSSVEVTYVDELSISLLRSWVNHLQKTQSRRGKQGGKLSDSTIHQYAVYTHTFCHWLETEELLAKSITARFTYPRVEKKFIPTFTHGDVEKMLAACEADKRLSPRLQKALTARNRAIVSVLIDTGIRRKELVSLRLCDVDRELRVLLVHRKGNKWQQVPISYDGFKPLHEYLVKHRPVLAALDGRTATRKEDAVFLAVDGKPLTVQGIWHLFRALKRRTGIDEKRVSPHQCRRYMATTQLAAGRSPLDVQRQMGHTSLLMTNHYASLDVQQLKRSHEMYSPLRAKQDAITKQGLGTGYWEEE